MFKMKNCTLPCYYTSKQALKRKSILVREKSLLHLSEFLIGKLLSFNDQRVFTLTMSNKNCPDAEYLIEVRKVGGTIREAQRWFGYVWQPALSTHFKPWFDGDEVWFELPLGLFNKYLKATNKNHSQCLVTTDQAGSFVQAVATKVPLHDFYPL